MSIDPSPPSAIGHKIISCLDLLIFIPLEIPLHTWEALKEPLNLSGAIKIFTAKQFFYQL